MSDERPFHERDLYRRYVDRGIAIDTALAWLKANDFMGMHADECAIVEWRDRLLDPERTETQPDCTCAFGRLVKQLEGVR